MSDANFIYGDKHRSPSGERGRRLDGTGGRPRGRPRGPRRASQQRRGAGVRLAAWLLIGVLALPVFPGRSSAASFQEYQLKAVFLYNFINFITWPDEVFRGPEKPFTIGILGKDPFGSFLEKVVANESFKGRPILLKRRDFPEDLADCQIIFIGKSNRGRLEAILPAVSPRHVLTVGDFEGFIESGGMINLIHARQRVRIEINAKSTRNAGLGVSSKLLRVARIVNE